MVNWFSIMGQISNNSGVIRVEAERIARLETEVEGIKEDVGDIKSDIAEIRKDGNTTSVALAKISVILDNTSKVSEDISLLNNRVTKLELWMYRILGGGSAIGIVWLVFGDHIKSLF